MKPTKTTLARLLNLKNPIKTRIKNLTSAKQNQTSKNLATSSMFAVCLLGIFGLNGCFGYRALPSVQNPQENPPPRQCAKIQSVVIGLLDDVPCEDCAQKDGIKELETPKKAKKPKNASKTQSTNADNDENATQNEPQNALGITQDEANQALLAGLNDLCDELQENYVVSLRYASKMTQSTTKGVFVATDTKQASVKIELEFVPDFFNGERRRFSARANAQMEIKGKKVLEIGKKIDLEPKDRAYLLRRAMDSAIKEITKGINKARASGQKEAKQ
ncbi:hypothetical protein [Helicobacter sp. T3_23-1056]